MAILQGATLVLTPNWIIDTIFVDIQWDPTALSNPVPQGPWGGRLALLAGTGSYDGQWDWDKPARKLLMWVPVSQTPLYRRLTGVLDQFTFPPANGAKGTGRPGPLFFPPTTQPLGFDWEVRLTMPVTGNGP